MADTKENEKLQTVANISTLNVVSRCKEEVKDIHDKLMAIHKTLKSINANDFYEFDDDNMKRILYYFDDAFIATDLIVRRIGIFLKNTKA